MISSSPICGNPYVLMVAIVVYLSLMLASKMLVTTLADSLTLLGLDIAKLRKLHLLVSNSKTIGYSN